MEEMHLVARQDAGDGGDNGDGGGKKKPHSIHHRVNFFNINFM
jgi:hypothetical protein